MSVRGIRRLVNDDAGYTDFGGFGLTANLFKHENDHVMEQKNVLRMIAVVALSLPGGGHNRPLFEAQKAI